jgi:hypothetical protein
MPSQAFGVFSGYTSYEVETLIGIFRERNAKRGPNTNYSLLYGGLTLLVSGWETYCEDVAVEAISKLVSQERLRFEAVPDSIRREILKYASGENLSAMDPLASKVARLPGNGWKTLLQEMVKDYLSDFNTPKFRRGRGKNLVALFKLFLDTNMVQEIDAILAEQGVSNTIDKIVTVRGAMAHRGFLEGEQRIYADDLQGYLNTVRRASAAIDVIIYTEFRGRYGLTPWNITKPIREVLPNLP